MIRSLRRPEIICGLAKKIIANNWGLNPQYLISYYTTVTMPITTYGAVVCWDTLGKKKAAAILNRLQRLACLVMTCAFKTKLTAALKTMINATPLPKY